MNPIVNDKELQLKILIAYYTRTGNTEIFANVIKEFVGGDLFRIEPVNKYPESYQETLKISKIEIDNHQKPQIKRQVEKIDQYNIVFVGTPNWYSTIAPPVATFLTKHNLSKKKVIPYSTHGGGGEGQCLTDIGKLSPKAEVLNGLAIYESLANSSKETILSWLRNLQIFDNLPP
ncbi:MAG: flavodoxin [Asgard group archaeon]|nr:flavodoxin [Asgard group archaeon]